MPSALEIFHKAEIGSEEPWDVELPDQDAAVQTLAKQAYAGMQPQIDAHEGMLGGESSIMAGRERDANGAMYYDFHRAGLIANAVPSELPEAVATHRRTAEMADTIRSGAYSTPDEAAAAFPSQRLDAMRQHALWAHSAWVRDPGWLGADHDAALGNHFKPHETSEDDVRAFHQGAAPFASVSRGPQMANVSFVDPSHGGAPNGATVTDGQGAGSMILGGKGAVADHLARSLAVRHLGPDFRRFSDRLRARSSRSVDPIHELSDHAYRSGNDHVAEWGHALGHSVLGQGPFTHPVLRNHLGPNRRSVEDLEHITGVGAAVHPSWHRE